MTGPTREEVEALAGRLEAKANGWMLQQCPAMGEAPAVLRALRERLEAAEARSYALAVAIMGGEDAPGYADSVPTQVLVDQQRKMAEEWVHAVSPDEARAPEAAAWEAGRDAWEAVWHKEIGEWEEGWSTQEKQAAAHALRVLRRYVRELTPPTDATAALTAVKDAEWNAAIEAAASWHESEIARLKEQVIENNAYLARVGAASYDSEANRYCFDQITGHQQSVSAIRALRRNPKEGV